MKEKIKDFEVLRDSLSQTINDLERLLDTLLTSKKKYFLEGKSIVEIDSLIFEVVELLPLSRTKQRYLPYTLKRKNSHSQIRQQINLIYFKRLLLKNNNIKISPGGNDKLLDMNFAKALGIPTPLVYQENMDLDDISFEQVPFVLKPTYGANANNVYYIYSEENMIEVKSAIKISSINALHEKIFETGYNRTWQTEQLMIDGDGKPSTDLKVYAYYGETGGIMEVLREDKTYRCWYSPEGEILESENLKTEWFNGKGFSPKLLEYANKIALATPTPFLRIDFYQDADEYYLGEITPHPGKYYTEYSPQVDSYLGRCFVEAEARLFADLIKGKKFDMYFDTYKGYLK